MSTTVEGGQHVAIGAALRAAGGAAAVALVLNLADRLVAGALGADFQVTISGTTQTVGAVMVTTMTLVPMLLGAVALVVASRWGRRGWDAVGWLGLALGVVSAVLPLTADADAGTRVALALMHLVAGVTWLVAVRAVAPTR
jgi:hypothetical protein